jgi:anti-sigma factor RsiW
MRKKKLFKTIACRYVSRICAYADHELATSERLEVEAHLPLCATCRTELEQLHFAKGVMQHLQPPDGVVQLASMSRFQSRKTAGSILKTIYRSKISLPVPAVVALAAFLLVPMLLVLRSQIAEPAVVRETVRVEVPVERLVTQPVYVQVPVAPSRGFSSVRGRRERVARKKSRDALEGFRPAETANLRIVTK